MKHGMRREKVVTAGLGSPILVAFLAGHVLARARTRRKRRSDKQI